MEIININSRSKDIYSSRLKELDVDNKLRPTSHKSNKSDRENKVSSATNRDDNNLKPEEEKGSHVAAKFSHKVSRFFDYYNEALRRRLIRELEQPTKAIFIDTTGHQNSGSDTDDEDADIWKKGKKGKGKKEEECKHMRKLSKTAALPSTVRKTEAELKRLERRQFVLNRFRKKANIIIFCIRCVKDHCFKFRERSELTPYMNTLHHIDYKAASTISDLMFDRSTFLADRQLRVSEEIKRILSMRKSLRSENELYTGRKVNKLSNACATIAVACFSQAQIALRNIRSFAELPVRMQRMIASAGVFESYESKRVITREGHPPASYYFILSGAVVSMKMDPERPIASAVAEHVKGDTFEENPMITDQAREVTVLTKEPCEFLSISASDYKNIFMQGGVKNLNDPDQELFLKSLNFLRTWPIGILQEHPKEFRFHYFKRGAVLADDSRKSEWLYIVKSGSIAVLKKLRKVGPYEWRKNTGPKPLTTKEKRERELEKEQWRWFVSTELRLPLRQRNEVDEIEERVDGKPKPFQHPDIKVLNDEDGKDYYPNLWTYKGIGVDNDEDTKSEHFANINKQFLYTMSTNSLNDKQSNKRGTKSAQRRANRDNQSAERPKTEVHPRSGASSRMSGVSSGTVLLSEDTSESLHSTRTLYSNSRSRTCSELSLEKVSETDLNPQFVKIQTLVKGDVWGLADLMFDEQPSFIVVSNGADCVLINKQFYLQNCSEKLQRKLRADLCPYPRENDLQDSLQISVDWNAYRDCELSSTMKVVGETRNRRDKVHATNNV